MWQKPKWGGCCKTQLLESLAHPIKCGGMNVVTDHIKAAGFVEVFRPHNSPTNLRVNSSIMAIGGEFKRKRSKQSLLRPSHNY